MRSKWKHIFYLRTTKLNLESYRRLRIYNRNYRILPGYIGKLFEVYNGKKFLPLKIVSRMVGYKFGEFILNREIKRKKNKSNKKKRDKKKNSRISRKKLGGI